MKYLKSLKTNRIHIVFLLICTALLFTNCDLDALTEDTEDEIVLNDNEPDPGLLINPADSDALSEVLIMPSGTESNEGAPPSPSNTAQSPSVSNLNDFITSSNGATAPLNFAYSNVSTNLGGCYVQINGAGNYFTVPYNSSSSSSGNLQLPIGIPTNVDEGEFSVSFCVYDTNGLVSNVVTTVASVIRLGTGAIQISLSWNTATDQDLYVTEPSGNVISYLNPESQSGGRLDRDDTDGYGPENIFWLETAPEGDYNVEVRDYEVTATPNTFYLTINGYGQSRTFNGTTQNGNAVNVVTFSLNGSNLTF
jgi:hypothetical protein